jgi:hypothetical protein
MKIHHRLIDPIRRMAAVFAIASLIQAPQTEAASGTSLREAVLLYAPFDGGLDATIAAGDPKLYTAPTGNRSEIRPGLPDSDLVLHVRGEGRYGDALRFMKKMRPVVFFKGEKNLGYNTNGWSGSCSVWLKLDPDKDLEPGYCDPIQYVAQAWGEGNMFIEFSKDHTPRHFRYAILSVTRHWNPNNLGWEVMPEPERPMIGVHHPPFRRDRWTHVVFTFTNINSGQKNSVGKLYLDGKLQGSFGEREHIFNWDISQSALTLGLSYVGWLDDLAVFNRPLTDEEVEGIYFSNKSIGEMMR